MLDVNARDLLIPLRISRYSCGHQKFDHLKRTIQNDPQHVILVGDVSCGQPLTVICPESHIIGVSDVATSFYLDHVVRTRISKYTCGSLGTASHRKAIPQWYQRFALVLLLDGTAEGHSCSHPEFKPNHFGRPTRVVGFVSPRIRTSKASL